MDELIKFTLLGLGAGALYAIAAQGMVLIYRGSGVVNFAHGAMALLSAAIFVELRNEAGAPLGVAIPAAVLASAGAGFLLDRAVMRRIRRASPLSRLVVTLGFLGIIESLVVVRYGSSLRFVDQYLPDQAISIAGAVVSLDRLLLCLIAGLITALLAAVYRHTDFGRQTTAVAENTRTAAAAGINPELVSQLNWTLGAGLAGLSGILLAPLTGLQPAAMVLLINPVLAGGLINEVLSGLLELNEWQGFVIGAGAIAMVLSYPDGLVASRRQSTQRARVQRLAAANSGVNSHQGRRGPAASDTAARVTPLALQLDALTVRYGGVTALDSVSLRVMPGEVVGLIGPNGAGKTTLLDAVSGFVKPLAGSICFDRREMTGASVDSRVRAGLGRSFQSLELFDDLSVREHLSCAGDIRQWSTPLLDLCRSSRTPLSPAGLSALNQFGLHGVLEAVPGELGFGQRRLLGIARAVAAGPSILLLDEPAAGLDSEETRGLGRLIRALARDWGMAVLLVEHDMTLVMSLCDRIEVLDFGRPLAAGTPQAIGADPRVIKAYLGTEAGRGVADE